MVSMCRNNISIRNGELAGVTSWITRSTSLSLYGTNVLQTRSMLMLTIIFFFFDSISMATWHDSSVHARHMSESRHCVCFSFLFFFFQSESTNRVDRSFIHRFHAQIGTHTHNFLVSSFVEHVLKSLGYRIGNVKCVSFFYRASQPYRPMTDGQLAIGGANKSYECSLKLLVLDLSLHATENGDRFSKPFHLRALKWYDAPQSMERWSRTAQQQQQIDVITEFISCRKRHASVSPKVINKWTERNKNSLWFGCISACIFIANIILRFYFFLVPLFSLLHMKLTRRSEERVRDGGYKKSSYIN